jgi:predicted GH43/DUF377 family glycosyl hydrolase
MKAYRQSLTKIRLLSHGPGALGLLLLITTELFTALLNAQVAGSRRVEPVLHWADASRNGKPFSKDPCVIRLGQQYVLYYSMPPSTNTALPRGWGIGIAQSKDLVNWTKAGELLGGEQACDQNGICAPEAILLDGRVHLFYQTYGNGAKDAICHAVSEDGVAFVRDAANPVFSPTGSWTSGRAIDAEVFVAGERLLLLFATRDPSMKTQMLGVAGARLNSGFSKGSWQMLKDGPVLKPELSWERQCIEAASVIRRGKRYYMFYAGGYNNEPQQLGLASSRDGIHWFRTSEEPFLPNGAAGEWNSSESGHPAIFEDTGGRTYLFFQGNNDKGRTWFLSAVEIGWNDRGPFVHADSRRFPVRTAAP